MEDIEKIRSKFIEGKASEDELKCLSDWLSQHPGEKGKLFGDKDILDAYALVADTRRYQTDHERKRLLQKIGQSKASRQFAIPYFLKVAAVLLLAFLLGWGTRPLFFKPEVPVQQVTVRKVQVPRGQVNQFFLADGSLIWVNSGSTMEVPSVFTGDKRAVRLSGEAFFEVAKDPDHPFQVNVDGQTIEVTGTSFNVRAYDNSRKVQTTLKTGRIKLITSKGYIELSPGQQAELDKTTGRMALNEVNASHFDSWKDGRYEFVNENLIEVFHMVERWYDVQLIYDEADFKAMNFSGVIKRDKPVQHFLALLGHSIPIRYEVDLDKVKIEKIKSKQPMQK